MAITAKALLTSKTEYIGNFSGLVFHPDYNDSANKEWASSTPSLEFKMTVKNEIAEKLNVGEKYTVIFELS